MRIITTLILALFISGVTFAQSENTEKVNTNPDNTKATKVKATTQKTKIAPRVLKTSEINQKTKAKHVHSGDVKARKVETHSNTGTKED